MRRSGTFIVGILVLAASGFLARADKKEGPDIRGVITVISKANADQQKQGMLGSIRVEGRQDADTSYDKAQIQITKETKIERLAGKDRKAAGIDDLAKGSKVQAIFIGPVAESYPVMATAKEILILD